jgi:hypothetical protein
METFEDFGEILLVFLDSSDTFLRVLPVLSDMPSSLSMSVVRIIIMLVVCKRIMISHKTHIVWNMHLLGKILDVKAKIYYRLFEILSIIKSDKERPRNLVNMTSRKPHLLLNLNV